MQNPLTIAVVGGGAAGFFSAITAKATNPQARVIILEKTAKLLSKVRISGGGRCNVTHACFDPKELVKNYPRGYKELLGPFYRFQPKDTIAWFLDRGVRLVEEEDGRMFPSSNSSEEIIRCLTDEAQKVGVEIRLQARIDSIEKLSSGFALTLGEERLIADKLLLATGSTPIGHEWAQSLGHTIQAPVPSLFTFNVPSFPLVDLAGISVPTAALSIVKSRFSQIGPLLITHWGFSGPAALKLSAFAARFLNEQAYKVEIKVNWIGNIPSEEVIHTLLQVKKENPKQTIAKEVLFELPKNLWQRLVTRSGISLDARFMETSDKVLHRLSEVLLGDLYSVEGKTTHKAEFVTCGGITLSEVNFKTMESKFTPGLYFAGEILDVDGITGGFNFQNAWTTGYISGSTMAHV